MLDQKFFGAKQILVWKKKIFIKILAPKFWSKNFLGLKKIFLSKINLVGFFFIQKFWGKNKIGAEENSGSKTFWVWYTF